MCTPGICKFKMLRMPNVYVCVCGQQVEVGEGEVGLGFNFDLLKS